MELDNVIKNRRSTRKFKDKQITKEQIYYLINNARLSPSAHNLQPWHYFVFTDSSKNRLLDIIHENITNKSSLTYYEKIMKKCLNFLVDAPAMILVYSDKDDLTNNDILSIGSSIEHICLSATNINIGSLWLGAIVDFEEVIFKEFKIDMKLVSALALGYADEVEPDISRKSTDEILSFK